MGKILVVGVGPGSGEYLTPAAREAVARAQVLVGGRSALDLFPGDRPSKVIGKDLEEVLGFIRLHRDMDIAVLTSGDPGFYSILALLTQHFPSEEMEVVPGISSLQLCFARMKEPWHDCRVVSLHGRGIEGLPEELEGAKKLAILTDPKNPPEAVARLLLRRGVKGKRAFVCDSLATPQERVVAGDLESIARERFTGYCVMVIKDG